MIDVRRNPIVIRDQFAIETPKKIIDSKSGEFELLVYDTFYRVLDRKTSELILERSGWDPYFSPGSRFLGASALGAGFEVIDLYAGTVISAEADLVATKGFGEKVELAAWSTAMAYWR